MSFCSVAGQWRGTAEVYGGDGRFLGNGVDQRYVTTDLEGGRTKIELSFTGPFKFAGHYVIADRGKHRIYEGPVNCGFAEAVGSGLVQADNYWPSIGLSQRFFLMMLPGESRQLSLALLSRGERLVYAVVGENHHLDVCGEGVAPSFVDGASIDLAQDPAAGRGALLLHRPGRWTGKLTLVDGALEPIGEAAYEETLEAIDGGIRSRVTGGGFAPEPAEASFRTDGWQAWSGAGDLIGSYALFGGRALSGQFHRMSAELRIWRREVVSHDGTLKAVIHNVYRGQERIGVQHGVLKFREG
jgi:hypothetical protein